MYLYLIISLYNNNKHFNLFTWHALVNVCCIYCLDIIDVFVHNVSPFDLIFVSQFLWEYCAINMPTLQMYDVDCYVVQQNYLCMSIHSGV